MAARAMVDGRAAVYLEDKKQWVYEDTGEAAPDPEERKAEERAAVIRDSMRRKVRGQIAIVEAGGRVFEGELVPERVVARLAEMKAIEETLVEEAVRAHAAAEKAAEKAPEPKPVQPKTRPPIDNYVPSVTGAEAEKRRADGKARVEAAKAAAEAEDARQRGITETGPSVTMKTTGDAPPSANIIEDEPAKPGPKKDARGKGKKGGKGKR